MSIELDFAGPLDPSHKNEAKVCYFHFYLVLGLLRDATSQRHRSHLSLHAFIWKKEISASLGVHTSPHTSRCSQIRLVGGAVTAAMMRRGVGGGAGTTWSRGGLERDAGLAAQQLK